MPLDLGDLRTQFRNLVFEGGGVWGIAYAGALEVLDEEGILEGIERVAGASAGAITAALLACGYGPRELEDLMRATPFASFMDDELGYARDTARLLGEYGWFEGRAFLKWIRKALKRRTREVSDELGLRPPRPLTFRHLAAWQSQAARAGRRLPAPTFVGSNLTAQRRELYDATHTPDLGLARAVRRSMSIPLFFAAERNDDDHVLVDGGLTYNFPLDLYDRRAFVTEPHHAWPIAYRQGDEHVFNEETLGFRLDTRAERRLNLRDWSNAPMEVDNIVQYAWAIVTLSRAIANKAHLHKNDWTRVAFVDVGDEIGFTDFDLDTHAQDDLVRRGREGVREYLAWRASDEGRAHCLDIYEDMDD